MEEPLELCNADLSVVEIGTPCAKTHGYLLPLADGGTFVAPAGDLAFGEPCSGCGAQL